MKIQIITNNLSKYNDYNMQISSLNQPISLDSFEVNIIDLNYNRMWENHADSNVEIDCINDFRSLQIMLKNSKKSKNVIVFPQNILMKYAYGYGSFSAQHKDYCKSCQLKDMLGTLGSRLLPELLGFSMNEVILYENSTTRGEYKAAFCFFEGWGKQLTKSDISQKTTTVQYNDKLILTFLDVLQSQDALIRFLDVIHLLPNAQEECPKWVREYVFGNDIEQREIIQRKETEIQAAKAEINEANKELTKNLNYKSILYTNGEQLVSQVFVILEKILECDMSSFEDEKKEDFLIQLSSVTFIGEIKGITSNVKSENISQLEVHYQGYLDRLEDEGNEENVKPLLIINPLRSKPLNEREPVHEKQIELAKKYGTLIIETSTLLKIFEKYLAREITTQEIIQLFASETGLLKFDR